MTLFLTTTTTPLLIATLEPDLIRQVASPHQSFKVIYPRLTRGLLSDYALSWLPIQETKPPLGIFWFSKHISLKRRSKLLIQKKNNTMKIWKPTGGGFRLLILSTLFSRQEEHSNGAGTREGHYSVNLPDGRWVDWKLKWWENNSVWKYQFSGSNMSTTTPTTMMGMLLRWHTMAIMVLSEDMVDIWLMVAMVDILVLVDMEFLKVKC